MGYGLGFCEAQSEEHMILFQVHNNKTCCGVIRVKLMRHNPSVYGGMPNTDSVITYIL